jgi:hypothetical protein
MRCDGVAADVFLQFQPRKKHGHWFPLVKSEGGDDLIQL